MLQKKSIKFLFTLLFSTHIFLQANDDKVEKEVVSPLKSRFDVQIKKAPNQNRNILIAIAATCAASALTTYGITYALQIYNEQKELKQQKSKIDGLEKKVTENDLANETSKKRSVTEKEAILKEKEAVTSELKKQIEDLTAKSKLSEAQKKEVIDTFLKCDGKEILLKFHDDEKTLTTLTILYNRLAKQEQTKDNLRNSIAAFIDELKIGQTVPHKG
jgi:hypothetical protein